MELTREQHEKVVEHLQEKFSGGQCPICEQVGWDVQRRVFQVSEYAEEAALYIGGARVPFVVIACRNCGNMVFLNAIRLGIVTPDKKNDGEKAEKTETP